MIHSVEHCSRYQGPVIWIIQNLRWWKMGLCNILTSAATLYIQCLISRQIHGMPSRLYDRFGDPLGLCIKCMHVDAYIVLILWMAATDGNDITGHIIQSIFEMKNASCQGILFCDKHKNPCEALAIMSHPQLWQLHGAYTTPNHNFIQC